MLNEEQFTEKLESLAKNGFRLCPIDAEEDDSKAEDDPVYPYDYAYND